MHFGKWLPLSHELCSKYYNNGIVPFLISPPCFGVHFLWLLIFTIESNFWSLTSFFNFCAPKGHCFSFFLLQLSIYSTSCGLSTQKLNKALSQMVWIGPPCGSFLPLLVLIWVNTSNNFLLQKPWKSVDWESTWIPI